MSLEVVQMPLSALNEYEGNAKVHDEANVEAIRASIRRFGMCDPIGVWTNPQGAVEIVEGHGRKMALQAEGYEVADVIFLDHLTDEERRAYALAHNQTTLMSDFDLDILEAELDMLADFDMGDFGFDVGAEDEEPVEVVEDEVPEDAPSLCKAGDVWQLGRHRLMCGDSTSKDDVAKLMDGAKADMVFTDPPYNIASDSKNFAADCSKAMEELSKSEWDKNFDIEKTLEILPEALSDDVTCYICTSHFLAPKIWNWMKTWAEHCSYCVWSKPNPMPSLAKRHWTWNTELICYATRGKHTFNFPKEGHALSTWTISKKNGSSGHPTEKPVEVPFAGISHSSRENDSVLDLFGGSGSTLIACEQLNRTCYMMELDPHYCDVIIERWQNLTGGTAVRCA